MPNALTQQETLAFLAETTWGSVAATPTFAKTRFTSIKSKQEKQTAESQEVLTTRSIADIIRVENDGGIGWNFELSNGIVDSFLAALLGNVWTANVCKNSNVRTSFSIERQFNDIAQFLLYKGAVPQKLDLSVSLGNIIGGSWDFVSKFPTISATTASTTAPATAASTSSVFDPISSVQLIQEGGAGSVLGVTECALSIANTLIEFDQLANVDPADIQLGDIIASGKLSAYFADATYLTKFLNHTYSSIQVKLGGAGASNIALLFPRVQFTAIDVPNQGKNGKIIQALEWKAMHDPTLQCTVQATRVP